MTANTRQGTPTTAPEVDIGTSERLGWKPLGDFPGTRTNRIEGEVELSRADAGKHRAEPHRWFEEAREPLFRYAMSLCSSIAQSDDLIQETFIRALRHASTLDRLNPYQQEAWLKRVLRNHYFDECRAAKRKQTLLAAMESQLRRNTALPWLPDLDEILGEVSDAEASLLEMRFRMGMNSTEIGKQLGIPAATIRSRLARSLRSLRTVMTRSTGEEL